AAAPAVGTRGRVRGAGGSDGTRTPCDIRPRGSRPRPAPRAPARLPVERTDLDCRPDDDLPWQDVHAALERIRQGFEAAGTRLAWQLVDQLTE
ncbi:hypothetical protein ACFRKE_14950, partial [Kitasatospora indigofera]|uniref:hypothetical protein n=1 Tax=Kitasatospora indigofera TaxID=67307 RepID=UPI00368372F6